jgi:sigma-B regulation protein RsbU (phosphoserine phosphatase)
MAVPMKRIAWLGGNVMQDGKNRRHRARDMGAAAEGPERTGRRRERPLRVSRHDLAQAARVQRSFLPDGLAGSDAFDVAWYYRPACAVGGDLLDVVPLGEDRMLLFIADAIGHGVKAALIATTAKVILHTYRDRAAALGPGVLLARLNALLGELLGGTFVTAAACLLDARTGLMRYTLAGHPPILVADRSGVMPLECGGLPLGVDGDSGYPEGRLRLHPDAVVLLYTDGVIEARSVDDRQFGSSALTGVLGAAWPSDAAGVVRSVLAELDGFRRPRLLADDIAIVAARYSGAPNSSG